MNQGFFYKKTKTKIKEIFFLIKNPKLRPNNSNKKQDLANTNLDQEYQDHAQILVYF